MQGILQWCDLTIVTWLLLGQQILRFALIQPNNNHLDAASDHQPPGNCGSANHALLQRCHT